MECRLSFRYIVFKYTTKYCIEEFRCFLICDVYWAVSAEYEKVNSFIICSDFDNGCKLGVESILIEFIIDFDINTRLCVDWNVFYFQGGSTMKFAILILVLCLSTYIPRMLPALFMDKIQVSGKVATFLQLIPYTAMASLVFPAILYVDENMWIGVVAGVVAVIAALKKLPVIGVVLWSVIACVILYMFLLS